MRNTVFFVKNIKNNIKGTNPRTRMKSPIRYFVVYFPKCCGLAEVCKMSPNKMNRYKL